MSNRIFIIAVALGAMVLISIASLSCEAGQRAECAVCGMWIDLYMKTRHVVILKDDTEMPFCSISCAARFMREHEGETKEVKAADYLTTELVDANEAFYLEGSDAPPVMGSTSMIAFSSRMNARRFRMIHGGRIISFDNALKSISIRR